MLSLRLQHGSHFLFSVRKRTFSIKFLTKWFTGKDSTQCCGACCGSGASTCRLHFGQLKPLANFCPLVDSRMWRLIHSLQKEWRHGSPTGSLKSTSQIEQVRKASATSGSYMDPAISQTAWQKYIIFCNFGFVEIQKNGTRLNFSLNKQNNTSAF